jgi:hypothetical protein
MTSKNHSKVFVDHNASVQLGIRIDGVFTHKLPTGMVVSFKLDGKPCSGVLHVSQFPSNDRAMRDKMFGVATVGMPAPGLTVVGVEPPSEDKRYTRVRLSARPDKENADAQQRFSTPVKEGSNAPAPSGSAKTATRSGAASTPKTAVKENGSTAKVTSTATRIVATSAAVPVVVAAPIDPVVRGRQLSVEASTPARSCGLADLGRSMAIARLSGDTEASALLGSIESHLSQIDALAAEATRISSSLSSDTLTQASALYSVRAQKRELDVETAVLRQESARYAGLCGKIKRAGDNVPSELQSQADELKSALETKRAALKDAYAANKKLDDDADLGLLFAISAPDLKAAMAEALEIAGKLADAVAKRDQLVSELSGMIDAYEKRLG